MSGEVTDLAPVMNPLAEEMSWLVGQDPALALSLIHDAWNILEKAIAGLEARRERYWIDRPAFIVALEEAIFVYQSDPAGYTYHALALPVRDHDGA